MRKLPLIIELTSSFYPVLWHVSQNYIFFLLLVIIANSKSPVHVNDLMNYVSASYSYHLTSLGVVEGFLITPLLSSREIHCIENPIYLALLVHRKEFRNELCFDLISVLMTMH
jgi:hypothetical protein